MGSPGVGERAEKCLVWPLFCMDCVVFAGFRGFVFWIDSVCFQRLPGFVCIKTLFLRFGRLLGAGLA
jgi:hypothetical protein